MKIRACFRGRAMCQMLGVVALQVCAFMFVGTINAQTDAMSDSLSTTALATNPLLILDRETSRVASEQVKSEELTTRSQYRDESTSISKESLLADELSTTGSEFGHQTIMDLGDKIVEVTTEPIQRAEGVGLDAIPKYLDKSTTSAQLIQLHQYEERGHIGEAYLIARDLVKNFPTDEYAYDAAIRNSLILGEGMEADTENLFKQAMVMVDYPGKYYVQFAHVLLRREHLDEYRRLCEDYAELHNEDDECTLTLARMSSLAGEYERVIELLQPLRLESEVSLGFPEWQLLFNAYVKSKDFVSARALALEGVELDFGAWEKRTIFMSFLKLPTIDAEEVVMMARQVLSNEQDYHTAKLVANKIIEQALNQRFFEDLQKRLDERIANAEANHVEVWLATILAQQKHDPERVRHLLTEVTKSTTPVIAYERAQFYKQEGNTTAALEIMQDLLEEQWSNTDIRLQLVELYFETGKPLEAAELLDDMTTLWVSREVMRRVGVLSVKAAMRMDNPQYLMDTWVSQADIAQFSDLLLMGDQVILELGTLKNSDELLDLIEQRLKQPNQWALYLLKARLHAIKGDQRAVLESYLGYLDHHYDNIPMTQFVAKLASQVGRTPIKLMTRDGEGEKAVTISAVNTNNTDIAIELYKRLIRMQPMVLENYSALMRVYQSRGEAEKAKSTALELADYESSFPLATNRMAATILADNGFAQDSLPLFRKALNAEDRFNYSLWFRYAQALVDVGDYAKATEVYHNFLLKGVSGHPVNQPVLLANLQTIAQKTNTNDSLCKFLVDQRNVKLPGKPEFLLSSAKLLMQLEKMDLATTMIAAFQEQYPHHELAADSTILLGQMAAAKGRPDYALIMFQSVITNPEMVGTTAEIRARFEIGELQRKQGNLREAIATWTDLKARFPENNTAIAGVYEAAMLAWFELHDCTWATGLLNDFIASGSTDLATVRRAHAALEALANKTSAEDFQKILPSIN